MDVRAMASDAAFALTVLEQLTEVAYHQYKEKKLKKRIEEINEINNLHNKYLTNIPLNSRSSTTVTLPKIFIFDDPNDPKTAQIPKLSESCLECKSHNTEVYNDPYLSRYGYLLFNAVRGLKLFYKSRFNRSCLRRGDPDDPTSGTLCYLIEVLNKHCKKFRGYDTDIAYIGAIAEFINAFASLHKESSERFTFLTEVYTDLMDAQEILREHSLTIHIKAQMSELVSMCQNTSAQMIKLLTKFITPNENWTYIEETKIDWLAQGLITPAHEFSGAIGQPAHEHEIEILDCSIKDWIKECAKDYLTSIKVEDIEKTFCLVNRAYRNRHFDKKDLLHTQKIFLLCKNFLTIQTLDKNKNSMTKLSIPLSSTDEMQIRLTLLADFSNLIGKLIALQFFGSYLWLRIKQFGEIYVDRPHHLIYTLNTLQGLGEQLINEGNNLNDRFKDIAKNNKNIMLHIHQQRLHRELTRLLDEVITHIGSSTKVVGLKGIKILPIENNMILNAQKDRMLKLAKEVAARFDITVKNYTVIDDDAPQDNELKVPEPNGHHGLESDSAPNLDDIFKSLTDRLHWMVQHEVSETPAYQTLLQTLLILKWKCDSLAKESRFKAIPMRMALTNISQQLLGLLTEPNGRGNKALAFTMMVKRELSNKVIDEHKNKFYGLFFKTASRHKANAVIKAAMHLSL